MTRKLTAIVALAVTTVTVASTAAAGPVAARQQISIQVTGIANEPFVLNPVSSGVIKRDTGTATFCCWTSRQITREGQAVELNDPQMTLTGKRGTLVVRNHIEWVDVPDGWAVFTGTWKVIRGTGDYAGVSGGGRGAGVALADNHEKSQFEGFLGR